MHSWNVAIDGLWHQVCAVVTAPLVKKLSADGDVARNERRWSAASALYAKALSLNSKNAPILVQYGHALKESGDVEGGLQAYRRALDLDPANSDTALQIGHAEKLLGRRSEAIEWYVRAVLWQPPQGDALKELRALDASGSRLTDLVDRLGSATTSRSRVIWRLNRAAESEEVEAATAVSRWGLRLMSELQRRGVLFELEKAENSSSAQPSPGDAFFVPLWGARQPDEVYVSHVIELLDRVPRSSVILYIPDSAYVSDGRAVEGGVVFSEFEVLIQRSSFVITDTEQDAEIIRSIIDVIGVDVKVESIGLIRPLEKISQSYTNSGKKCTLNFTKQLNSSKNVAVGKIFNKNSENLVIASDKYALEVDGVSTIGEAAALSELPSARSMIVMADAPNSSVWIALALEAGIPVIVEKSLRLYSIFGSSVDAYISFQSNFQANWIIPDRSSESNSFQLDRWATAIAGRLKECADRNLTAGGPAFKFGQFYSLASAGNGLTWCREPILTLPELHGLAVPAEGLKLKFTRVPPVLGRIRLALLAAMDARTAVDFFIESIHGSEVKRSKIELSGVGWGWLAVDVDMPSMLDTNLEIIVRGSVSADDHSDDANIFISGLIAYPLDEDNLWFEFLDRASSGEESNVRFVRNWSKHKCVR